MKRGKYRKNIALEYQYKENADSEKILALFFDSLFSKVIRKRKQLQEFFSSKEYLELSKYLKQRDSVLVDFLEVH